MSELQSIAGRRATSVRLFLEDGTPDGLRTVTKSNWTGLATTCSRTQYLLIHERDVFARPGVYVLIGDALDGSERQRVYIGQADNARERLDSHIKGKDFWTHVILFTSQDDYFNRVHAQYIESRLITLANRAKRSEVENAVAPRIPSMAPAERADAEGFLEDMLLIYPLLGIDAFEIPQSVSVLSVTTPVTVKITAGTGTSSVTGTGPAPAPSPSEILIIDTNGADARGRDTSQGFQVLTGSKGRSETVKTIPASVQTIRQQLIASGVLVERDGVLHLTQDYVFSSPSQAASVMIGGSVNGRIVWHDASGRTLKAIQEAQLAISVEHDQQVDGLPVELEN